MSLILEALRKSEAERRRGQVPGLHAAPAAVMRPARDMLPPWVWPLLALVAVTVLALLLWLARSPSAAPEAVDGPAIAPIAAPVADSGASSPTIQGPATAIVATAPDAAFPAGPTGSARDAPFPSEPRSSIKDLPVAANVETAATVESPQRGAVRTTTAGTDLVPARGEPAARATPATPAAMPAPAADPVVAVPAPVPPATARTSAAPLRLSDLDSAQRQQLPPLKMSMHMWAPTQRFAIIDGNRVAEGDRVGDAVVAEITATGVVLDWQGLRLQIPTR